MDQDGIRPDPQTEMKKEEVGSHRRTPRFTHRPEKKLRITRNTTVLSERGAAIV